MTLINKPSKKSILIRILQLVLAIACLQTAVFYCLLIARGTVRDLNANSADALNQQTMWRTERIENDMVSRWGSMQGFKNDFENTYYKFLTEQGIDQSEFNEEIIWQKKFLADIAPELISMLRQNKVNGAFLILSGGNETAEPLSNQKKVKQGISIRDIDQNAGYSGNDDLLVSRAPASILEELNISLDSHWEASFIFTEDSYNDYYFKPLKAITSNPEAGWEKAGYWAPMHKNSFADMNVISYSVPLQDKRGNIIGVAGVEIAESYLKKILPYTELDISNNGEYVLAMSQKDRDAYQIVVKNGYSYDALSTDKNILRFSERQRDHCRQLIHETDQRDIFGSIHELNIYEEDSYYGDDHWYIVGMLNEKDLYSFSFDVEKALLIAGIISFISAIAGGIMLGTKLVKPIRSLATHIQKAEPEDNLMLPRTNIQEIDGLVIEIEQLQNNVLENNRKLSEIISLSGMPISAFEIDTGKRTVFYTDYFFRILDYKIEEGEQEKLKEYDYFIDKFKQQDEAIVSREKEGDKLTANYCFQDSNGKDKWARVQAAIRGDKVFGIMMDVSREFIEKNRLQHERDHDLLTNLLNRRAFRSRMKELFQNPLQIGIGAMIMIDLDNLKYINDSYGHDCGDSYIKEAAAALEECTDSQMILARMSGDEFNVFLMHYDEKEQVRAKIQSIHEHIKQKTFTTVREKITMRMTGGIAWFPEDASDCEELMHLADFAMYQAKKNSKGEFWEFDKEVYARDSFLLKNRGELNTIIEKELVEYHFQPIVNLHNGRIFAYEALMRPSGALIKRPDEILALAKTQGRLYHIERLTWYKALKDFTENAMLMNSDCKVFINSISSQVLNIDDFQMIQKTFQPILNRIVVELTEEERLNNEYTDIKRDWMEKWKAELALDDFGSGYNGENLLLDLNPNYIKIDMNIIRNIDRDENRQMMFNNLISYTRSRGIKVIAEGVETKEELFYVKNHGADFVQGYFVSKPRKNPEPIKKEILDLLQ